MDHPTNGRVNLHPKEIPVYAPYLVPFVMLNGSKHIIPSYSIIWMVWACGM